MLSIKNVYRLLSLFSTLLTIANITLKRCLVLPCLSRRSSLEPSTSSVSVGQSYYLLPILLLILGCSESDNALRDNGSSSSDINSPIPTANTTIDLQDGSLILTAHSMSVVPPANISALFNVKTETGKPVANLMIDDFQVYEDGALSPQFESQPKIIPEENEFTYSTMLLLDFSASVITTGLEQLKQGAAEFVYSVMEASGNTGIKETAIFIFDGSHEIFMKSNFTKDTNELLNIINSLDANDSLDNSSTNLYGAIVNGLHQVENQLEDNAILNPDLFVAGSLVLFSDGRDLASIVSQESALRAVNNASSNIALFTIGLGDNIDSDTLRTVGRNGFEQVDSLNDLVTAFNQVGTFVDAEANSFYRLDYCSPRRAGSDHELKVVVQYEGLTGSLRIPYSADQFTSGCQLD